MKKNIFNIAVLLNIAGAIIFLSMVAYLGTFTRYLADDYCETYTTQTYSPSQAVLTRYEEGSWRAANRYSNLFFVGVVESLFGAKSMQIVPAALMVLWALGLIALTRQVRKLAGVEWHILMDVFLGTLLAFLSILEAPNPYQTFYWRSSMATHFVPFVFINIFAAFLLSRFHSNRAAKVSLWLIPVLFLTAFILGGFSEPPLTVMIVGVGLGLVYIWFFVKNEMRNAMLFLVGSVFVGALSALAVMAVSPAVSHLSADSPSFVEWVQRTVQYTYFFLIDAFKTLPLPILFGFLCPAIFMFVMVREKENSNIGFNAQVNNKVALALPFILILLIAAGFSTSAYGQSYPVERARFFAFFLMTITFALEGLFLGLWLTRVNWKLLNNDGFVFLSRLLLLVMAIYPFRAGLRTMQEIPEYRARAQAWDRRDAHIYKLHELGKLDLTVPQFDGVHGVKELDSYPSHWVNVCAAKYYQVNSIRAIPIHGDEELDAYYDYYGD